MYQVSTVLGSLVSLLAGTIDFSYKKALHTSYIVSETLSRAPDSPLENLPAAAPLAQEVHPDPGE